MMAFFAIARDSFREAADRKISRIMFLISIFMGLLCLTIGLVDEDVAVLVGHALKEAGGARRYSVEPVDARTVDLVARAPEPSTGEGESLARPGEAAPTAAEALSRVAGRVRHFLERRGVREVKVAEPDAPCRKEIPRLRLALDYEPYDVRGGTRLSLFFGAKDAGLDWDLGGSGTYGGLTGREVLLTVESFVAQVLVGWGGLIVAVIATAGFVPSMLAGGTAHLFLAKPVRRSTLLLGKYAGGIAFIGFHATVITLACATAIFIRTGWFDARFLMAPVAIAGLFSVLYAVSCLAGVLFGTPVVSILLALALWMGCWVVATGRNTIHSLPVMMPEQKVEVPKAIMTTIDVIYYVLPKTTDIGRSFDAFLSRGRVNAETARAAEQLRANLDPFLVIWTTAAFTACLVAVACLAFRRRDY